MLNLILSNFNSLDSEIKKRIEKVYNVISKEYQIQKPRKGASISSIQKNLSEKNLLYSETEIVKILKFLTDNNIIIKENDKYLPIY